MMRRVPVREGRPMRLINTFLADETGTSAIEYGLVAAMTSLAIIGVAGTLGLALADKLDEVIQAFVDATG
jgi:Flp pilus assembly pilin Flp